MDLTKYKLHIREDMTSSSSPIYLLVKGSSRVLISIERMSQKGRKDLSRLLWAEKVEDGKGVVILNVSRKGLVAYPLAKGGYQVEVRNKLVTKPVPKGATRAFRVHPNRLSEKQRAKMVGAGEGGEIRRTFIEDGLTTKEQIHRAKEENQLRQADFAKKERQRKRERRRSNRGRSDYETPGGEEEKETRFEGIEVKEIAQRAKLEPTEVRRFLRAKKIGKRGGRYAFTEKEASKVIRAVKKHYSGSDSEADSE